MSINQCQTGIDDSGDIPPEMFDNERVKLGKKGMAGQTLSIIKSYIPHDIVLIGRNVSKCLVQIFTQIQLSYNWK